MEHLIAYGPALLRGTGLTVTVALCAMLLATLLGALGAAAKIAGGRFARGAAQTYSTLVRGVPELVLMLLAFYGGQRLVNSLALLMGYERGFDISPFAAGVGVIGFVYGAYMTETFRGAWLAVPKGQWEAAQASGMSPWLTLRRIMAPQVMRHALPGYANIWLVLIKATAIVSIIGLQDVVNIADKAGKSLREPFTFFLAVMAIFLILTSLSGFVFRFIEKRVNRGGAA
ncbi:ABC transporter permease subunit [Neomegalonema sp.]|uniref:ABC transporter permease n=1 Tax=Neomegalonema sp. TaxID=2039713 RepID=UPI002621B4F9|nr:ABC transporter permease subunit [Neomegalonema sp.]MDD2868105.1 ABC transporter permease subunit [Neomegalonema sp.]